jgi:hypothetical protein
MWTSIVVLFFACLTVSAQTLPPFVTVYATHLMDKGSTIVGAQITLTPSLNNGLPTTFRIGSDGGHAPLRAISVIVTGGSFTMPDVVSPKFTTPLNVCWHAVIRDIHTQAVILDYPCLQPSADSSQSQWCAVDSSGNVSCNLDAYLPPSQVQVSFEPKGDEDNPSTVPSQIGPASSLTAPQPGVTSSAVAYLNPAEVQDNSQPYRMPWNITHTVPSRYTYSDTIGSGAVSVHFKHGGTQWLAGEGATDATPDTSHLKMVSNFLNLLSLGVSCTSNTDVQVGGCLNSIVNCYGTGDCIPVTDQVNATGPSRATDEGTKHRVIMQYQKDVWGITINSVTQDADGQAIITPLALSGIPQPLTNHRLQASSDSGTVLNLKPSKVYTAGNVSLIEQCPTGTPNAQAYMCLVGDAATDWSRKYGTTGITTLTADLTNFGTAPNHTDPLATGPMCIDASVAELSVFTAGSLFTISGRAYNFEQPIVLSKSAAGGAGKIHACFKYTHVNGETMTAGAIVGHALSLPVDDMLPCPDASCNPGIDNQNTTTMRTAYPLIAIRPGNVAMVWVNSSASFGPELKTKAFDASTPMVPAVFTATLSGGTLASMGVTNAGDYHTKSTEHTGADILPAPAIAFTGSCMKLPTAHSAPVIADNHSIAFRPVIDSAGLGCTSLSVSVQSVYPNAVSIYSALWLRSNQDPNFVNTAYLKSQGITDSTDGYALADGYSADFTVGDPIERSRWWQNPVGNTSYLATPMGKSRSLATGGDDFQITGANGYAGLAVRYNATDSARYYGNASTGWGAGFHGEAELDPPSGIVLSGPVDHLWVAPVPTPRAGSHNRGVGILIACGDLRMPCSNGNYSPYDLFSSWTNGSFGSAFHGTVDPGNHTLDIVDESDDTGGHSRTPSSSQAVRVQGLNLLATQLGQCTSDPHVNGTMRRVAGQLNTGDAIYACLKNSTGTYTWNLIYQAP